MAGDLTGRHRRVLRFSRLFVQICPKRETMVGRTKSRNMKLELPDLVDVSEDLIRLAAERLPSPQLSAAALALALGRVTSVPGVNFEAVLALVRIGRVGENLDDIARASEDEETPALRGKRKPHGRHGTQKR